MGNMTFRHDLNVYRGTYAECMAQPTENMKVYLAWDTREIYIGNKTGKKVRYGVPESIFKEIDIKIADLKNNVIDQISVELKNELTEKIEDLREDVRDSQVWKIYD